MQGRTARAHRRNSIAGFSPHTLHERAGAAATRAGKNAPRPRAPRGRLPLHVICAEEDADLDFVKFLLEANPRAVVERTAESVTALEIVEKGRAPLEIIFPLSAVALMIKEVPTCAKVASLVKRLNAMNWPRGVFIYMDLQTSVTHFLSSGHDIKMMPQILSVVAHKCKADTLFSIVKERLPGIIR